MSRFLRGTDMSSGKQLYDSMVSFEEQKPNTQAYQQSSSHNNNHSPRWEIDEQDVIVIGAAGVIGDDGEIADGEAEKKSEATKVSADELEKWGYTQGDEDEEGMPFPRMHKIIFVLCLVGVLLALLYILNYWGVIPLP